MRTHRATTNRSQEKPVAVFLVFCWCCAVLGSDKMALRARRVMARAKDYSLGHSYGASWLILWLLLVAQWVRLVCDSTTTSFIMYYSQDIQRTASKCTSVKEWLDSAACKSTNRALLRNHMYINLLTAIGMQLCCCSL